MVRHKKKILSPLAIALVLFFLYLPILLMIVFSFNESKSLTTWSGFSFQWYENLFRDREIVEVVSNTLIVAVLSTIISTIIGTITAIGLSKSKRVVKDIVLNINNLPILNPEIVTAIGLMLLIVSLNIEKGLLTMLLAHIGFCIPYVILSVLPKMRRLDDNIVEAALDLGATPWQALTKIIVPQLMPAIISGALIAFTMSFDDFVISYFVSGSVKNISIFVYTMRRRINPSVNALSSIIVLVITVVLVIINVVPMFVKKKEKVRVE